MRISSGTGHTCALSTTNKVKCFGYNEFGQLGYGDTNNRGDGANEMGDNLLYIDLGSNFTAMQIMALVRHTCALSNDNKVKCFGDNTYGQLGLGDRNNRGDGPNEMGDNLLEIDLGASFIPIQIMPGTLHTCALSTTNKVKCWGYNLYGQLGYGDTNNRGDGANEMGDSLLEIDLGSNFTAMQIIGGWRYTCALSTENKVKCWGYNQYGLGYEDSEARGDGPNEMGDSLLEIDLGSNFTPMEIVGGWVHVCALSTTNTIKCFGYNEHGQLGLGDTNNRGGRANEMGDNLLEIDLGSNFIPMQIVAGRYHTCALSTANKAKCWGYNFYGQLGYGDLYNRGNGLYGGTNMGDTLLEIDLGSGFIPIEITAGSSHTCALSTTNTIKCFGSNGGGQLGYGDTHPRGDGPNEMGDNLLEIRLGMTTPAPTTPEPTTAPTTPAPTTTSAPVTHAPSAAIVTDDEINVPTWDATNSTSNERHQSSISPTPINITSLHEPSNVLFILLAVIPVSVAVLALIIYLLKETILKRKNNRIEQDMIEMNAAMYIPYPGHHIDNNMDAKKTHGATAKQGIQTAGSSDDVVEKVEGIQNVDHDVYDDEVEGVPSRNLYINNEGAEVPTNEHTKGSTGFNQITQGSTCSNQTTNGSINQTNVATDFNQITQGSTCSNQTTNGSINHPNVATDFNQITQGSTCSNQTTNGSINQTRKGYIEDPDV